VVQLGARAALGKPREVRPALAAAAGRQGDDATLFLGGREDWNVPLLNAELFYQSLRKRGIATELVVYPGMHHGGWDAEFEQDYLERVVAWFDNYLKP
jgi:dipeptidyl aminopeptidase/acylaminoacyl peptidase